MVCNIAGLVQAGLVQAGLICNTSAGKEKDS
jgi:hypothetical protein